MAAQAFTRNYADHSNDTGYQFEFHCDKCGSGFRSSFQGSVLGVGSKIAKGLGSLFGGGKFWAAGVAADHMKDGLRGKGWDDAFNKAIDEIKPKFHQCTRCGKWVCPEVCWNGQRTMCKDCAPDLAEEAAHHQAHIAADQIAEKMRNVDQVAGIDPAAQMLVACPNCQAKIQPGKKFCGECGKPVGSGVKKAFCTTCGVEMQAGAKFCGDCGATQ